MESLSLLVLILLIAICRKHELFHLPVPDSFMYVVWGGCGGIGGIFQTGSVGISPRFLQLHRSSTDLDGSNIRVTNCEWGIVVRRVCGKQHEGVKDAVHRNNHIGPKLGKTWGLSANVLDFVVIALLSSYTMFLNYPIEIYPISISYRERTHYNVLFISGTVNTSCSLDLSVTLAWIKCIALGLIHF